MMKIISFYLTFLMPLCVIAQTLEPIAEKISYGKPALPVVADLADFDSLPDDRRKLISEAIDVAIDSPWLPYTARGAKPSDGGFDCSGAMYFVLRKIGLDPPRTASGQLQWLKQNDHFHEVPLSAVNLNHASLKNLQPGDLLFWGRRGLRNSEMAEEITHVAMFLGYEKKDKHPVMINSTDGRSYRGIKANGYGMYDFRLPSAGSRISFIGYGSPPGLSKISKR